MMSLRRAGGPAAAGDDVQVLDPSSWPPAGPTARGSPAQALAQAPPAGAGRSSAQDRGRLAFDLIGPRGHGDGHPAQEFDAVIVTANNQADLQLALQIIKQLQEYIEERRPWPAAEAEDRPAAVRRRGRDHQHGQPARGPGDRRRGHPARPGQAAGGFPSPAVGRAGPAAAVGRRVGPAAPGRPAERHPACSGPDLRFPYYETLIKQLDIQNTNLPVPIPLKKASAQQVAQPAHPVLQPSGTRARRQTEDLIRFTYDTSSNTVFVQAGKGDLDEIRRMVEKLDNSRLAGQQRAADHPPAQRPGRRAGRHPADGPARRTFCRRGPGVVQDGRRGRRGSPGAARSAALAGAPRRHRRRRWAAARGRGGPRGGRPARDPGLAGHQHDQDRLPPVPHPGQGRDRSSPGYLEDVHITPDIRSNTPHHLGPEGDA